MTHMNGAAVAARIDTDKEGQWLDDGIIKPDQYGVEADHYRAELQRLIPLLREAKAVEEKARAALTTAEQEVLAKLRTDQPDLYTAKEKAVEGLADLTSYAKGVVSLYERVTKDRGNILDGAYQITESTELIPTQGEAALIDWIFKQAPFLVAQVLNISINWDMMKALFKPFRYQDGLKPPFKDMPAGFMDVTSSRVMWSKLEQDKPADGATPF